MFKGRWLRYSAATAAQVSEVCQLIQEQNTDDEAHRQQSVLCTPAITSTKSAPHLAMAGSLSTGGCFVSVEDKLMRITVSVCSVFILQHVGSGVRNRDQSIPARCVWPRPAAGIRYSCTGLSCCTPAAPNVFHSRHIRQQGASSFIVSEDVLVFIFLA